MVTENYSRSKYRLKKSKWFKFCALGAVVVAATVIGLIPVYADSAVLSDVPESMEETKGESEISDNSEISNENAITIISEFSDDKTGPVDSNVEIIGSSEVMETKPEGVTILVGMSSRVGDAESAVLSTVVPVELGDKLKEFSKTVEANSTEEEETKGESEISDNSESESESLEERFFYALYDTEGKRNDLNEHYLNTLVNACNRYNVSPDLMLGIIMTESEGHIRARSKSSTATGFCQILKGTGKSIYENLLGNPKGSYDHSMAYDGDLNIIMGVAYVADLKRIYRGNTYKAIQCYRGKSNISGYLSSINKYVSQVGLNALEL